MREKTGAIIALAGAVTIVITLCYKVFEYSTTAGLLYVGFVLIILGVGLAATKF